MRIAMAQINSFLGGFSENAEKIKNFTEQAIALSADMVVFPEASLFGYHPMDLLERKSVVDAQLKTIEKLIKKLPKNIFVVFGAFWPNPQKKGKAYYNMAVVVRNNRIVFKSAKTLLPTYDVFDDARHIEPGRMDKNIFTCKGKRVLFTVCEDIWAWPRPGKDVESMYPGNPLKKIKSSQVDLVVNLSASPFYPGKIKDRLNVVRHTVRHLKAPMVYVNMVGGQDEIVFDGGSFALSEKGELVGQGPFFCEHLTMVDLEAGVAEKSTTTVKPVEQIRQALALGLQDFCRKTGLEKVHLGLSGGIDSAVVACLARDALGPSRVTAIAMPGPHSTDKSLNLARQLADNLGIDFETLCINSIYDETHRSFSHVFGESTFGIMHENLQARLRAVLLMAYSNRENSLLLNTSNKTELATGYSTLYGDQCGGLCPVGDLLKGEVYALAEHYNAGGELIPREIISRAPSAELAPDQKDQDSLPPYNILDKSVENLVEYMRPARSPSDKFLLNAMLRSEFKRWQAPPILKVSEHSFGRGRRMPVAHKAIY